MAERLESHAGQRLWVRPSFCQPPHDGRIDIVLDPGMAFGTGTHPTTQLCLEAVERVCVEMPPATVLDMGAGSGILAITALKLGAGSALAIDMEEESVEACQTNAAINDVKLDTKLDDVPPNKTFNLVVANILAAPLVWMAKELTACVRDHLVLSGLRKSTYCIAWLITSFVERTSLFSIAVMSHLYQAGQE